MTTTTPTPALYFSPQPTRSARARWAFLEAKRPFEGHPIDIFAGEHKSPDYLSVNELGLVPAATFDGEVVIESSALALIVTAGSDLMPETGTADWRRALQWAVFAPAELDHALATINEHRLFRPPAQRSSEVMEDRTQHLRKRIELLERALGEGPYLLGDTFTVADIAVGHSVVWMRMHDLVPEGSVIARYLDQLTTRPAFVEVYGPKVEVFPDPHAA